MAPRKGQPRPQFIEIIVGAPDDDCPLCRAARATMQARMQRGEVPGFLKGKKKGGR